jgi:hypothetical protein
MDVLGTLPLFVEPPPPPPTPPPSGQAMALGMAALKRTAAKHEDEIARLVPLAQELARTAGEVTVADLRLRAVERGLLSGSETSLHFLGTVMRRAGLRNTGRYRRSDLDASHGRHHVIWRTGGPSDVPGARELRAAAERILARVALPEDARLLAQDLLRRT